MKLDYESGIRVIRTIHQWDRTTRDGGCDCHGCTAAREAMREKLKEMLAQKATLIEMSRNAPLYVVRLSSMLVDDEHKTLVLAVIKHEIDWLQGNFPQLTKEEKEEEEPQAQCEGQVYTRQDLIDLQYALEVFEQAAVGSEFFGD